MFQLGKHLQVFAFFSRQWTWTPQPISAFSGPIIAPIWIHPSYWKDKIFSDKNLVRILLWMFFCWCWWCHVMCESSREDWVILLGWGEWLLYWFIARWLTRKKPSHYSVLLSAFFSSSVSDMNCLLLSRINLYDISCQC